MPRGAAPGERRGGRLKGTRNKTTVQLKEAILAAAARVGEDGNGKRGTEGYLTTLAKSEPRAFAGLLGRVLPLQLTGNGDGPIVVEIVKFTDVDKAAV